MVETARRGLNKRPRTKGEITNREILTGMRFVSVANILLLGLLVIFVRDISSVGAVRVPKGAIHGEVDTMELENAEEELDDVLRQLERLIRSDRKYFR